MKEKKILAAMLATAMLAASGCGYVEDIEPEEDGAGLAQIEQQTEPDEQDEPVTDDETNEDNDAENANDDSLNDDDGGQNGENEFQTDDTEDNDSADDIADDSYPADDDSDIGSPKDSIIGEGDYKNAEFGIALPLPDGTHWKEYNEELVPWFDDMNDMFRILMETENENDWVLSVMYYQSDKTLDDFAKNAWERDYRNSGDTEDMYEVLDTQCYDTDGRETQLITEKLMSSNGEFYYGYIYVTLGDGEYIWFRMSCPDEATLSQLCDCVKGVTFN